MSKSTKDWARKAREDLIEELGGVCHRCGDDDNLTFDCIKATGDDHHRGSTDQRMCYYRKQYYLFDNIQLLCFACNGMKGDQHVDYRPENRPPRYVPEQMFKKFLVPF